jgi:hypothetical protein
MTSGDQTVPVYTIDVEIVRFTDPHQPGWVECVLRDVSGREWTIIEKVPVVSDTPLDATSIYPQLGIVACELVRQWTDEQRRTRCIIDTERPLGIEAKNGETRFEVFIEQIKRTA